MYKYTEALAASVEYFDGDELAAKVFVDKYALRDNDNNILEKTPDDMHHRLAKEFARVEAKKFNKPLTESQIYNLFKNFKRIVPQGSPMYGIGNKYQYVSIGNCFVIPNPYDSYLGIMHTDTQITQISSRRGGVGWDDSDLRPIGMSVRNAAKSTTGATAFMKRFSNTIREVGQCICEGQRVLTERGLIPIEDISIGEKVWTKNGWIAVTNVYNNGIKPIYQLSSSFGYKIRTSDEHIFLNEKLEEVKLKDIELGDQIVLIPGQINNRKNYISLNNIEYTRNIYNNSNRLIEYNLPSILDEKLAYILGYSYGDGYINDNVIELASSHDYPEIEAKLINYIHTVFNYKATVSKGDGAVNRIRIHSKQIVQWLRYNQICKQKAGYLIFPEKIKNSPHSVQLAFVSGYFDADGTAKSTKTGYSVTSIDSDFISEYQNILMSVGVVSKKHLETSKIENWKDKYSVCVVGKYAQNLFKTLMIESFKVANSDFCASRDNILTPYNCETFNINRSQHNYIPNKDYYISTYGLSKLKTDGLQLPEMLVQDSVSNIEYIGDINTFDLELESEHLFYCEGFYVHNSGRRGASLQSLHVRHPEVVDFIKIKQDLTQVTGSNISVKFTDDFLNSVEQNSDFELKWPVNSETPKISKIVKAKSIWDEFIHSAWLMAEPGAMFWDTVLRRSTTAPYKKFGFEEVSSNPCVLEGTLVETQHGNQPVETIKINDWIRTIHGLEQVKNIEINYNIPTFAVTFSNGGIQYISESHQYFKLDKYRHTHPTKLIDLNIGDEILFWKDNESSSVIITDIQPYKIGTVYDLHCPHSDTWITDGYVQLGCGEQYLPPFASCRLILINLYTYVKNKFTKDAFFDYEEFAKDVQYMQRLGDDMVDLELECIARIINKIKSDPEPDEVKKPGIDLWKKIQECAINDRRTGCGFTALADCIAALNMKFDSKESLEFIDKMSETLKVAAFTESVDMAKELGHFPLYDSTLDISSEFIQELRDEHPELYKKMVKYGRRNMTLLTVAPAGSVSCETQTSSGLESVFMLEYLRRKKGNPGDKDFRSDFVDATGDHWMEFVVRHKGLQDWMDITGETDIKNSPYWGSTSHDIDWIEKVKMQSIIQRHIDNSISVTVNLPSDVKEEKVSEIYLTAWKLGCKGMTIYRDGCRSGVLLSTDKKEKTSKIIKTEAPSRPKILPCDVHHLIVKGVRYFVVVGLFEGEPYEIFISRNCDSDGEPLISRSITSGNLSKQKRGHYNLLNGDNSVLQIVSINCEEHEEALARLVSTSLRHGADINFVVHQLEKTRGDMQSFSKAMARTLKKYIKDGTEVKGEQCQTCSSRLVRIEGCVTCQSCGWSKC